ncbi:hypothetical protein, partial [Burkholderia cepacia]|uniref:hypothetical protein n=1 Tax=Burkholderia cepacia TaxID=292 RepID=UPI001C61130E
MLNFLKIVGRFFIAATILASIFVSSQGFAGELGVGIDGSAFSQQQLRSLDYKSKDDIRKFMHKVDNPIPLHTSRGERLVNCRGLPFTLAFCAAREWH